MLEFSKEELRASKLSTHATAVPRWWQSPPLLLWVGGLTIAMSILTLSRVVFLLSNLTQFHEAPGVELFKAFVLGFRFDLATALITISLPLLPIWLPFPASKRRWLVIAAGAILIGLLVVATGFLWGDLLFFSENSRHITVEPSGVLEDIGPMVKLVVQEYPAALLGYLLVVAGIIWSGVSLIRSIIRRERALAGWGWQRLVIFLPIVVISIIGGRGGVRKEPLKSADAIFSSDPFVGNLALNGWYSFLTESNKHQRAYLRLPEDEAVEIVRGLVAGGNPKFEGPSYPLLRASETSASIAGDGKLNVVLIVVESLNAEYLQSFGGAEPAMPFLDSLARESKIFTNCVATGTRSFRGMTALLNSFPSLSSDPYQLTFHLPKMTGLGTLFKQADYHVRFMHAARVNSMGITAITRLAGYTEFVSADDFPSSAHNGSWGVWDHLALERMTDDLDQMPEPAHYGLFTLCTHNPWTLPEGSLRKFPHEMNRGEILNTYVYLDSALRDFFAKEATRERFKRTLYVLVGDHTTHAGELERFRVGCIFYAPGRLEPGIDTTVCSQLDILPSIIDLAGIETRYSPFGSSLFSDSRRPEWALMLQSDFLYWREGRRVLATDLTNDILFFDPYDSAPHQLNLLPEEAALTASHRKKITAIYQIAETMERQNRFVGPEDRHLVLLP